MIGGVPLSPTTRALLRALAKRTGAARLMDIGGSSHSHHSGTVRRLVRRGLVERIRRRPRGCRSSWVYVITDAGRAALAQEPSCAKI